MPTQRRAYAERHTSEDNSLAIGDRPLAIARPRAGSASSQSLARTPARSFYHRSFHGHLDPAQYSSEGVRDQTAELASYALSENASFLETSPPGSPGPSEDGYPEAIEEVSEPVSSAGSDHDEQEHASKLSSVLQSFSDAQDTQYSENTDTTRVGNISVPETAVSLESDERTSLLADRKSPRQYQAVDDIEGQQTRRARAHQKFNALSEKVRSCCHIVSHPKTWSGKAVYQEVVLRPAHLLPAVFLGLLLNILDALSYGMILFPLGNAIFDDLGSDGIAMFYVSTIVAQLVFSSGGSIFRGGIGSEMIEVVPFFHKMAMTILERVGEDNPKAVLATTVLSFALSSVLTGAVFFLMGACKLGSLIGFFPVSTKAYGPKRPLLTRNSGISLLGALAVLVGSWSPLVWRYQPDWRVTSTIISQPYDN